MKYLYSVVKFVPDSVRGEFVNLGLLICSDHAAEWRCAYIQQTARAKRFAQNAPALKAAIAQLSTLAVDMDFDSEQLDSTNPQFTEDWLERMHHNSQNLLQFSKPLPIIAKDIDEAEGLLWNRFIVDVEAATRSAMTKRRIQTLFRNEIKAAGIPSNSMHESTMLSGDKQVSRIDFAFRSARAMHITQCWSFQLKDKSSVLDEVRSWAWAMKGLRREGGKLYTPSGTLPVPRDVPVEVIVSAPNEQEDEPELFAQALDVFMDSQVHADITYATADSIKRSAEQIAVALGV